MILKIRFNAADWSYEDGWHGHNDRLEASFWQLGINGQPLTLVAREMFDIGDDPRSAVFEMIDWCQ